MGRGAWAVVGRTAQRVPVGAGPQPPPPPPTAAARAPRGGRAGGDPGAHLRLEVGTAAGTTINYGLRVSKSFMDAPHGGGERAPTQDAVKLAHNDGPAAWRVYEEFRRSVSQDTDIGHYSQMTRFFIQPEVK
ncbi:Protein of unknown function [Gryllus bimaculatus]|nr:Protein of unknown function [Gryllus bimaculatus]